jgi:hypothetical protein
MAIITYPYQSSDEKMTGTVGGLKLFPRGLFYIQYGATAAINTSTTATSVFTNTAAKTVNYAPVNPDLLSSLIIPANGLGIGTIIRGKVVGQIKNNTSTPNLTFDVGMTVGTTYTALMTTGAVAMISTATAAYVELGWEYIITSLATPTAATVYGKCYWQVVSAAGVPLMFDGVPGQSFGTFNSLVANTIDAQVTWGTSHANNEIIPKYAYIEVVG